MLEQPRRLASGIILGLALSLLVLGGCATQTMYAGPVVTSISAAGDGSIHVEKCMVKITKDTDWWTGSTAESTGLTECQAIQIHVARDG